MSILEALVLGAVQGLTEFIPISSSGHLVVLPAALGWEQPRLAFDVLLHLGSLIALVVYFRRDLVDLARGLSSDSGARRLLFLLVIGTLPAVAASLALHGYFEEAFGDAKAAAAQLVMTAVILVAGELALGYRMRRSGANEGLKSIGELSAAGAGAMGVAQAASILPGISRSGAIMATGFALALKRTDAARFAFLLAIPALAGAAVLELPDLTKLGASPAPELAGFLASALTSYAAIAALLRYLNAHTLYPFAAYCLLAGIAFFALV